MFRLARKTAFVFSVALSAQLALWPSDALANSPDVCARDGTALDGFPITLRYRFPVDISPSGEIDFPVLPDNDLFPNPVMGANSMSCGSGGGMSGVMNCAAQTIASVAGDPVAKASMEAVAKAIEDATSQTRTMREAPSTEPLGPEEERYAEVALQVTPVFQPGVPTVIQLRPSSDIAMRTNDQLSDVERLRLAGTIDEQLKVMGGWRTTLPADVGDGIARGNPVVAPAPTLTVPGARIVGTTAPFALPEACRPFMTALQERANLAAKRADMARDLQRLEETIEERRGAKDEGWLPSLLPFLEPEMLSDAITGDAPWLLRAVRVAERKQELLDEMDDRVAAADATVDLEAGRLREADHVRDIEAIKSDPQRLSEEETRRRDAMVDATRQLETLRWQRHEGEKAYVEKLAGFDAMMAAADATNNPQMRDQIAEMRDGLVRSRDSWRDSQERMMAARQADVNRQMAQNREDGIGPEVDGLAILEAEGKDPQAEIVDVAREDARQRAQSRADTDTFSAARGDFKVATAEDFLEDAYQAIPSNTAQREQFYRNAGLLAEGAVEGGTQALYATAALGAAAADLAGEDYERRLAALTGREPVNDPDKLRALNEAGERVGGTDMGVLKDGFSRLAGSAYRAFEQADQDTALRGFGRSSGMFVAEEAAILGAGTGLFAGRTAISRALKRAEDTLPSRTGGAASVANEATDGGAALQRGSTASPVPGADDDLPGAPVTSSSSSGTASASGDEFDDLGFGESFDTSTAPDAELAPATGSNNQPVVEGQGVATGTNEALPSTNLANRTEFDDLGFDETFGTATVPDAELPPGSAPTTQSATTGQGGATGMTGALAGARSPPSQVPGDTTLIQPNAAPQVGADGKIRTPEADAPTVAMNLEPDGGTPANVDALRPTERLAPPGEGSTPTPDDIAPGQSVAADATTATPAPDATVRDPVISDADAARLTRRLENPAEGAGLVPQEPAPTQIPAGTASAAGGGTVAGGAGPAISTADAMRSTRRLDNPSEGTGLVPDEAPPAQSSVPQDGAGTTTADVDPARVTPTAPPPASTAGSALGSRTGTGGEVDLALAQPSPQVAPGGTAGPSPTALDPLQPAAQPVVRPSSSQSGSGTGTSSPSQAPRTDRDAPTANVNANAVPPTGSGVSAARSPDAVPDPDATVSFDGQSGDVTADVNGPSQGDITQDFDPDATLGPDANDVFAGAPAIGSGQPTYAPPQTPAGTPVPSRIPVSAEAREAIGAVAKRQLDPIPNSHRFDPPDKTDVPADKGYLFDKDLSDTSDLPEITREVVGRPQNLAPPRRDRIIFPGDGFITPEGNPVKLELLNRGGTSGVFTNIIDDSVVKIAPLEKVAPDIVGEKIIKQLEEVHARDIIGEKIDKRPDERRGLRFIERNPVREQFILQDQYGKRYLVRIEENLQLKNGFQNAAQRFAANPPNEMQQLTMQLAIRELNRRGIAWTDHKMTNFDIVVDRNSRTGYKMVLFDYGGFVPVNGPTPFARYQNARALQAWTDSTPTRDPVIYKYRSMLSALDTIDQRVFGKQIEDLPMTPGLRHRAHQYRQLASVSAEELEYLAKLALGDDFDLPPIK
ncbi:MAG: hypothetical protein AAGK37_07115 [Pseudomonadota bacterium]